MSMYEMLYSHTILNPINSQIQLLWFSRGAVFFKSCISDMLVISAHLSNFTKNMLCAYQKCIIFQDMLLPHKYMRKTKRLRSLAY